MARFFLYALTSLFLALLSSLCFSLENYTLSHQPTAPVLDGALDEPQWQQATAIDLAFEWYPGEGTPAKVKTLAYLYEDGENLHLAVHAFDPNPEKIRAHLADRDAMWGDDKVGVILDTFNGERNAYEFFVNPFGVQQDGRMDDSNGWKATTAWNGIWYSAAQITDDGWTAEISIPFRALRFPKSDGELTWGIGIYRAYPRDVVRWTTQQKRDPSIDCNLCQFSKVTGFSTVKPGKNFQLTPTLTLSKNSERDDVPGEWEKGDVNSEPGIDLRWGITENAVLNTTINPDFSQVEADAAQLNVNNTYSLFLPEQRPFFLDGADYFTTKNFNLVHTRNIAEPDLGLKLTGKSGKHSYGFLLADDNSTTFLIPSNQSSDIAEHVIENPEDEDDDTPIGSNVAIARYRMDVGERGNIGALMTAREGDNYRNMVASIDGNVWLSEKDTIRYQTAFSDSKNPLAIQDEFELAEQQSDYAVSLDYIRDTRDYKVEVNVKDVGTDFRADLGFNSSSDFKKLSLEGELKFYGEPDSLITNSFYWADWDLVYDQEGNRLNNQLKLFTAFNASMQSHTRIGLIAREKYYEGDFNPEGDYFDELLLETFIKFRPTPNIQLELFTLFGDQIDYANSQTGAAVKSKIAMEFNLGDHLKIKFAHNYNTINIDSGETLMDGQLYSFDGGKLFSANQTDLRINYQFNIRSQLKFVMQHTNIERKAELYRANYDLDDDNNVDTIEKLVSSQLMYSYKLNSQSLFYLGFSDKGFQDDSLDGIEKDYRSIFAKVSYAWQN